MMANGRNVSTLGRFKLRVSRDDPTVAKLYLPGYPARGFPTVEKSVRLLEILGPYEGPDIYLDFDQKGVLVSIELLD